MPGLTFWWAVEETLRGPAVDTETLRADVAYQVDRSGRKFVLGALRRARPVRKSTSTPSKRRARKT